MLEQLMNTIRHFGQSTVVENPDIPNEHNDDVMKEAGSSIFSGLQGLADDGDADGLSNVLTGDRDHPAAQGMQNNFMDNIMRKFGINPATAGNVSSGLIPSVLGSLLRRPGNNNSNGLSLQNIISSLTGGGNNPNHQGLLSRIGSKLGLDKDGDGDVDLADIQTMFH
ncbi:MAG: hypothetical protein V4539_04065 [Bacteroidota bacterium]